LQVGEAADERVVPLAGDLDADLYARQIVLVQDRRELRIEPLRDLRRKEAVRRSLCSRRPQASKD
jgi:hypothetical protein